jgi:hypothetical protein
MTRTKKPNLAQVDCAYPSLRQSKLDRRNFLSLLGGGVAGSTLLSACYDWGKLPGDIETTTRSTDSGSQTTDTEWETNEPLAGDPPEPDFFHRRLPAKDFQILYLGDGSEVVYAVVTVFEEPLFGQMSEADLLLRIDEKLRTSHANIADYETEQGLDLVETSVREALTQACLDEKGVEPSFIEVTFIVERLRRNEGVAGDVADSDLWDTES